MKKIEAFIFDLDGVITDTAEYHYKAWKNLADKLGIKIDKKFNENLKGVSRIDSLELILKHGNVLENYSKEQIMKLAAQKNNEYVSYLANMSPSAVYPGIKELLVDLKGAKIKIVLASASKNAPQILEALQLKSYFDYIVNPDEVKQGKPAPDIFIRGAQAVGTSCENCVGIEDAVVGIEALKAANIFAIGVGTREEMEKAQANLVVSNTSGLILADLLQKI